MNTAEKNLGNLNVKIYAGQNGNIVVTGNMAAVLYQQNACFAQYRAANKATYGQSFLEVDFHIQIKQWLLMEH